MMLARLGEHVLKHARKAADIAAGAILEYEGKAARGPETTNRRRIHDQHLCIFDLSVERAHELRHQGGSRLLAAVAIVPRLEANECGPVVRHVLAGEQIEPADVDHAVDAADAS